MLWALDPIWSRSRLCSVRCAAILKSMLFLSIPASTTMKSYLTSFSDR